MARKCPTRYGVTINVTVVDSGRYYQTGADLWVHRRYHPGSVTSSRSTIYPQSTTMHDVTSLGVRPRDAMVTSTMRVRNRAAKVVVFTRAYRERHTYLRVRWDSRRAGRVLPAGKCAEDQQRARDNREGGVHSIEGPTPRRPNASTRRSPRPRLRR